MSDYSKNRFVAPHEQNALPPPDLTRMPAHLREAIQRPDPIRETEACGHLLVARTPASVPGTRVRVEYAPPDAEALAAGAGLDTSRVAIYLIEASGKERLAQVLFDREQVAVFQAALTAAIAEYDRKVPSSPA